MIVTYKGSGYVFKVRPLTAREFAGMGKGKTEKDLNDSGAGFKVIEDVLTSCVIQPKIILGTVSEAKADEVSLDSIPLDLMNDLFGMVFKISGLSPEEDEEQKNSSSPSS